MNKIISIMDTTLRDGEQTPGISYTPSEKLHVAKFLLSEVGVDRVEVASARVSIGEQQGAMRVLDWAHDNNCVEKIEVLGFCDHKKSVDWLKAINGKALNLLTKGSREHCEKQLGMTLSEHLNAIAKTIDYAKSNAIKPYAYLEDWSRGIQQDENYVTSLIKELILLGVQRVYLADTLGILNPDSTYNLISRMKDLYPDTLFEFHGHNDYGLATANALKAIQAGADGLHVSVNGMGERAGNTSLAEIITCMNDHTQFTNDINELKLSAVSEMVETFSGKSVSSNTPLVGQDVFTQTAGIHADGDAKGKLYETNLVPERFGRVRAYALGKLAGKASLDHNLKNLGISLSEENRNKVLKRVVELGDKKQTIESEDLLMIISDVLKSPTDKTIRITQYSVNLESTAKPVAMIVIDFFGSTLKGSSEGDGGFDALMKAITKALSSESLVLPNLSDFRVRIPPGGKTEALVETLIKWDTQDISRTFVTNGVDTDQLGAAVIAVEKMLNIMGSLNAQHK
jgi:D-citramalate synthase